MPSTRTRALVAASVALALLAPVAIGAASASPAPVPVCGPCGQPFEYATERNGVATAVTRSTATVRVHRNGSATWTVRNRLANDSAVERLRADGSLLDRVVADTFDLRGVETHGHVPLGASVDANGTVTMRYRTPGFATRANGVLRVEYFRDDPGVYVYTGLGADRLTLIGPEGTVVTSGFRGAAVDGRRLTATSFGSDGDGPFVVFAPADDPLKDVRTALAIGSVLGGYVARNALLLVVVPAGVLAALVAGVVRAVGRVGASAGRARRYGAAVAAAGALLVLHPWYADAAPLIGGYEPTLVVGGVAAAAVGAAAFATPDRLGLLAQFAVVVAALALGALAALALPGIVPDGRPPRSLVAAVAPAVPVLLSLPVGHAARHASGRARRVVLSLQPVGLALGVAYRFPLASAGEPMFFLGTLLLIGYAAGVVVLGGPLFVLGAALPGERGPGPGA